MKTVARLIFVSFTTAECLSIAVAFTVLAVGFGTLGWLLSESSSSLFVSPAFGFAAASAYFAATLFIPSTFSRLARSRSLDLLPYGRLKLMAVALMTTVFLAFPVPVGLAVAKCVIAAQTLPDGGQRGLVARMLEEFQASWFWYAVGIAVLVYTWLYLVMWSAAAVRNWLSRAFARTFMLACLLPVPLVHYLWVTRSDAPIAGVYTLVIVVCGLFTFGFLFRPRTRIVASAYFSGLEKLRPIHWQTHFVAGNETRWVLGLRRHWILTALIGIYALSLLSSVKARNGWLFYLTFFAMVFGGLPASIVAKARGLWLRRPWSRLQLFAQVERLLWGNATWTVALLVLCGVWVGNLAGFSWLLIVFGALHVVVTAVASVYLGLIQTRRSWGDAVIGIATFGIAMLGAAAAQGDLIGVPIVTALLAVVVMALRVLARRRWMELDWMRCKPIDLSFDGRRSAGMLELHR